MKADFLKRNNNRSLSARAAWGHQVKSGNCIHLLCYLNTSSCQVNIHAQRKRLTSYQICT